MALRLHGLNICIFYTKEEINVSSEPTTTYNVQGLNFESKGFGSLLKFLLLHSLARNGGRHLHW